MKSKKKYSDRGGKELSTRQAKKKPISALFTIALDESYNEGTQMNALFELSWRANAEVYKNAKKYCQSKSAIKRKLGIQILGSFGRVIPKRPRELLYFDERVEIALRLLKDNNKEVALSAARALASIGGDKAVAALIKVRKNKNDWVRYAVTYGLKRVRTPAAVRTLTELMEDKYDIVRLFATCPFINQALGDTPQIRRALQKRLKDKNESTRQHALYALANRKDPAAIKMLLKDPANIKALLKRLEKKYCMEGDEYFLTAAKLLKVDEGIEIEKLRAALRKMLRLRTHRL